MALGFITNFGKNELKCSYPVTKKQGAAKSIRCMQEFYDYFQNYINGTFPPRMWNVYNWSCAQIILWKVFIKGGIMMLE